MRIELINTGTELMLGRVLNTHQQWICRQLADQGYEVQRQVAVPDTGPAITEAVRDALTRADIVITTGGLGPTSDDITRDLIAEMFQAKLCRNDAVLESIAQYFIARKRPQPVSTNIQAMVPEGAQVLMNEFGTAPGLILEAPAGKYRASGGSSLLIMLPGPPRELRPMFTNQAMTVIKNRFPLQADFACITLKSTGIGESRVEEIITPSLKPLIDAGLELGFCARTGEVDVRVTARGSKAQETAKEAETIVANLLSNHIYGRGDASLEQTVVELLTRHQLKLALAESCTGGFIANRITNVPGASAVLWGGMVVYDNMAKQKLLGVSAETLATHGAVSKVVVREMAEGARQCANADYAIAVTGIAGPAGGSDEKPVGTVFIALASPKGIVIRQHINKFDRETFKYVTSQQALEMLRQAIQHLNTASFKSCDPRV